MSIFQSASAEALPATVLLDFSGAVQALDAAALKLFHLRDLPQTGRPVGDLLRRSFPPEQVRSLEALVTRSGSTGQQCSAMNLQTIDDHTVDLELTVLYPDRLVMTVIKRGHHLLPAEILDGVIQLCDAAIFILDGEMRIVECNDLSVQYTRGDGHSVGDIIGAPLNQVVLIQQDHRPFDLTAMVERVHAEGTVRELSAGFELVPEGQTAMEISVVVVPLPSVRTVAAVALRDIGENRRLRSDLQNLQRADDICRAAGGIAHELNNSSTTLMAQLERIERGMNGAAVTLKAELSRVHSAIRRVKRLGAQLERFSWRDLLHEEAQERYLSAQGLEEIVQETVSLSTGGTSVRTTFAFDPSLPAVAISGHDLMQALFNVLNNAVEAMDTGGTVHLEVRVEDQDTLLCIVVRDEGSGMDPRLLPKVFRPYFSTKAHGIGMGLTVTVSILEACGGKLTLETEPGFGTTVRLYLPIALPPGELRDQPHRQDEAGPPGGSRSRKPPLAGSRVLLVEDDALVRRSMEMMIQEMGCDVIAANSGEQAIALFQKEMDAHRPVHALITDLAMPGRVNGIQLIRRLREFLPDLPAVLSSGALHRNNSQGYREAGFQYVLRKPFGEVELGEALRAALGQALAP